MVVKGECLGGLKRPQVISVTFSGVTFSGVASGNAAWGFRTGQDPDSQDCSELTYVGYKDVLPLHPFSLLLQVLTGCAWFGFGN